jgi:hypothetical protein
MIYLNVAVIRKNAKLDRKTGLMIGTSNSIYSNAGKKIWIILWVSVN